MFKDWNFLLSLITCVVAVIALIQTQKQIKLSNKQYLFNKRMEIWIIAYGFIQLYKNNFKLLNNINKNEPVLAIDFDFIFILLTNNTYLESISPSIKKPLDESHHKQFLTKLEEIKGISFEVKLVFKGAESILLSDFIQKYQELLF